MKERPISNVAANLYEYFCKETCQRTAIITALHSDTDKKILIFFVQSEISKVVISKDDKDVSSALRPIVNSLSDQDYEKVYTNNIRVDMNSTEGTEKMLDLVRVVATFSTALATMKILRNAVYEDETVNSHANYATWGDWA